VSTIAITVQCSLLHLPQQWVKISLFLRFPKKVLCCQKEYFLPNKNEHKIHTRSTKRYILEDICMAAIWPLSFLLCQYQLLEVWPSHGNHGNHDRIGQLGEFPVLSPPSHVETRQQDHWVQSLRSVEYKQSSLPVERCWNILATRECMGLIIDRLGWVYLEEMSAKLAQKWEMEVLRMPKGSDTDTHRIHVWYIYLHVFMVNVGKHTVPCMNPMMI